MNGRRFDHSGHSVSGSDLGLHMMTTDEVFPVLTGVCLLGSIVGLGKNALEADSGRDGKVFDVRKTPADNHHDHGAIGTGDINQW